jgi:PTS system lactose-specific IIC component
MSFWLVALLLVSDVLIYLPFFLIHDKNLAKEEILSGGTSEPAESSTATTKFIVNDGKPKSILAMCASGATSSMLAKTIGKGAKEHDLELTAMSIGYGQHRSMLKDFDLVILAPQMASAFDELKHECDKKGVKAVTTSGADYVAITRDSDKALEFVLKLINE